MNASIIVPPVSTRLTTAANARGDLGLPASAPTDTQLERWIDQSSAQASTFCRRVFGRTTYRQRFDIANRCRDELYLGLLLDAGPVVSIQAVAVDGLLLSPDTYEVDDRLLYRLQDGDRRAFHGRIVAVEYVAGWVLPGDDDYASPPAGAEKLPGDIERAVIQLVGGPAFGVGRDPMVKSQDVEGIGSRSFYVQGASAALPHPEAEATLAQYRRLAFA
ncbi:hypothetical protein [Methylorubrum salsuginis]|uniref:Uncharacterized protein n=1 Tax=Methylorubrum salsuginis TaxID=414703 RepID=A0A1I4FKL8_9HYPH|nr:hypothetical protein [Methylorubrum salsuginis]SFL18495.1 hypothetical protein SAMN04488125_11094 [Methylorubrum salsuginis]